MFIYSFLLYLFLPIPYLYRTEEAASKGKAAAIHFSGDADEDVDLLNQPVEEDGEEDGESDGEEQEGEGGGEEEPEDDFNAAWEVLDLARALYLEDDIEDAKLKLADTYIALGDVSTETGGLPLSLLRRSHIPFNCPHLTLSSSPQRNSSRQSRTTPLDSI